MNIEKNYVQRYSLNKATELAIQLWSYTSAQYPVQHKHDYFFDILSAAIIDTVSTFSLNARRCIESIPFCKIDLKQSRWEWELKDKDEQKKVCSNFWDAINHIVHAQELLFGVDELKFVRTEEEYTTINEILPNIVSYMQVKTDRKGIIYIDIFALAHAFLYQILPSLETQNNSR